MNKICVSGSGTDQSKSIEMVALLGQIALMCANLKVIRFSKCCLVPCIADIFNANPSLFRIIFLKCKAHGAYPVTYSERAVLRDLDVQACELTASCANYFGELASRIVNDITDRTIIRHLVKPSVHLVRLDICSVSIADLNLIEIVQNCPHISALGIPSRNLLTDKSVQFAVQHLRLKMLDVGKTQFTDALLHAIVEYCPTLEVLLLERTGTFTFKAIANVVRKCPNIHTIGLGWAGAQPDLFARIVAPTFSNITTLILLRDLKYNTVLLA